MLGLPSAVRAQAWDSPEARELVARAVERRGAAFADSSLKDWSARAHGFVFFLGQIGEGLAEPPRLVKADQLELEVYWRLPNQSKQRIIGWRDQRDLPTDINYHRDHLGIAMGNFPDLIRLGEGDEVRDVPHPVSERGAELYEYALGDTLTIALSDRELRVVELLFRPKDFRAARIVGRLYVEIAAADLVRMSFSFTRAAYIDAELEDITVGIENSLLDGRWWLPVRQEIEIRRRGSFLDFPARGIIRGRFEIDGYQFNAGLDPALFRTGGPEIVAAPKAVRDSFPWSDSLSSAIREVARPYALQDFDEVRAQATAIAMGHVLTGLQQNQLAIGSISDFVHINRVEGLALGAGAAFRSANEARELRLRAAVGTATGLVSGGGALQVRRGSATWRLAGAREVREMGDIRVISRAVNSITSQEGGQDYGDYYLATGASLGVTGAVGGRTTLKLEGGYERIDSLIAEATWSRGAYARPNPGVDEGEWTVARLALKRRTPSFAVSRDFSGHVELEAGHGPSNYLRSFAEVRWQLPAGGTSLLMRAAGGVANDAVPRHRAFVLGGRGTLLGEPFRGLGGSRMGWFSAEWQVPVGVPEIHMGSFAGTGRHLTVAPNVAIGWMGGRVAGLAGTPALGPDVAVGLGAAWLHDLLRFDAGYGITSRRFGFSVDVSRSFWDIL